MNKFILSALLLAFTISGCRTGNMEELINKKEYRLAANPKITISFDNGSVFGFSGVNSYTGVYKIKDGSITFSSMGSTMMMGQKEDMDNETAYLASLKDSMVIKFDKENNLVIGSYLFIQLDK